jgi:hypothetical protein
MDVRRSEITYPRRTPAIIRTLFLAGVGGVNDPRQGVLEQVQIGVVADGVGEQGRDPGAMIVALGPTIARILDTFYP